MSSSPSRYKNEDELADEAKATEPRGRGHRKFKRTEDGDKDDQEDEKPSRKDKPKKRRKGKKRKRTRSSKASSKTKGETKDGRGSSEGTKVSAEAGKEKKRRRRRRRRRRSSSGSARRRRSSRSGSRSGSGGSRSSARSAADYRPLVERVKGGVKLFVGRLPVETTTDLLSRAFEEYGEVLEVFLIDGRGASGARCAFVRLAHLKDAERAMEEMHEKRVLIHERAELGPIQVAFAKGEATRMGLDAAKEQLPARWQVPITAGAPIIASGPVEPESLSKEALVSLIKEGQRSGGKSFKEQWWTYCDDGRGGVADYDPKRHPEKSLRQFFAACQAGEWGAKPWFRRAVNWATMGGDRGKRSRGRRRRRSSSSSSSGSSRSKSRSSSKSKRTRGQSEGSRPAPAPKDTKLGDQPPLPVEAPPPEPDAVHPPPKARLLASAAERDTELEDFLAKNRISPSTSFLMLKLTREQASSVMSSVSQALDQTGASGLARSGRSAAESLVLQKLKGLGVRAPSGGAWTSTERTASPVAIPAAERIKKSEAESREKEGTLVGLDLPSVDGLLGLVDLEEDRKEEGVETAEITEAKPDRKECPPTVESDTAATAADEKPTAVAEPPEAKDGETSPKEEPLESIARQGPLNCQVFVKNLDKTTGEPELRDLLSKHGTVQNVEMATEGTSVTKGFAIVIMSSKKEAKDCVKALNFTKPWGRALIVERPEGIEDSPSRSPSKEKEAVKPALSIEEQKRSKSKSRSVSHESGWSRYTIEGKGQRSRARRRSPRRRHQKRSRPKKKASRTRSSRSSSKGSDSSDSRSDRAKKRRKDRSRKRHRDRERPRDLEKEVPPMGLPGWPGAPPFMPMPGMPMMPPPWAMPPWGMPSMPGMTAVPMEHNGFPFDAEEAERQLRRAEKAARKEQQRQKEEDEDDKKQVWEDHPARMAQKKHSSSRSKSRKSRGRDHSRVKEAKRSKSSSSAGHSRSRRSRRQGVAGGNKDNFGLSVLPVSQKGAQELPNATMKDDSGDSDVDLSHVDLSKVQEEINFADI